MYEVAVTGLGIVSSIGVGVKDVTESLREGKSGIKYEPERLELGFRGALTGSIDNLLTE